MKLSFKTEKEKSNNDEDKNVSKDTLISLLNITRVGTPEGYVEVKRYPLKAPFSYAVILQNATTSEPLYIVDELPMNSDERVLYSKLRDMLEQSINAPKEGESEENSFNKQVERTMTAYSNQFESFPNTSLEKVKYYLERDIAGFGPIDALMHDALVEDISCGGVRRPVYLWHRNFESIRTSIIFNDDETLNDFVTRMVHRAGKHVSAAFPIADIAMPGNHRMAVLYQRELTPRGTSFTIRKFKEDPYTIVDLINSDTLDVSIVAYLWMLMENKMSIIVIGPTASGKTTLLNAITNLIQNAYKIFTIEDVAEINIPHENWFSLVSRAGFGIDNQGEISLFDLVKAGVRHRPDYIVVGEIRGEEAYVMFQALATGHGGLCTMHADSVDSATKRLMQKPMSIPPAYIPLMNCAIVVKRVKPSPVLSLSGVISGTRRITQVSEIISENKVDDIFTWDAGTDTFNGDIRKSNLLQRISKNKGMSMEEVQQEFRNRSAVIQWMVDEDIHDYRSVGKLVSEYYQDSQKVLERVKIIQ